MFTYRFSLAAFLEQTGEQKFLVFRDTGVTCYPLLKSCMHAVPRGKVLLIEVPNSVIIDYSFADETIGTLFSSLRLGAFGDSYAVVKANTVNQLENIEASFVVRKQSAILMDSSDEWRLVGHRPEGDRNREQLEHTLRLLIERGHLSASELSDATNLTVTACNNRLVRLYEDKLAHRERDESSREFIYYSLLSDYVTSSY